MAANNPFPNLLQMQPRVPRPIWIGIRFTAIILVPVLIAALIIWPEWSLRIVWKVVVPPLPLLFFLAPGLWRNICPLAATHQLARVFKFTRARTLPKSVKDNAFLGGVVLLLTIVPLRLIYLNENGLAMALFLGCVFSLAFIGGFIFIGKSGWCATFCPMLPIERVYGQNPFFLVRNSHCEPCVGCTKNCFDFNPRVAYLADLNDADQRWSSQRRLFIGLFPGFIFGFYNEPSVFGGAAWYQVYWEIFFPSIITLGVFFILDTVLKISTQKIAAVFAAAALNLFYWYTLGPFLGQIGDVLLQIDWPAGVMASTNKIHTGFEWTIQAMIGTLSVVWLARVLVKERQFVEQLMPASVHASRELLTVHREAKQDRAEITFIPNGLVCLSAQGRTLLEVAEANDIDLPSGCRMGMCGSDPICVVNGADQLSQSSNEEKDTLRRLGLAGNWRMACMARVQGSVTVSLTGAGDESEESPGQEATAAPDFEVDMSVRRVVIIGNGVAGATVADDIRRYNSDCEITLVAREPYHFYNRMAVSKLIYDGTDLKQIALMPPTWAQEKRIDTLLGSAVVNIDPQRRVVATDRGRLLEYDRLVLATGSSSFIPSMEGWGISGGFALRHIDDALGLRDYARHNQCQHAVVLGGGLLGLEAAHALTRIGLRATVIDRNPWILNRQLDQDAGNLLIQILRELHMAVLLNGEAARVIGEERVEGVELKDGRIIDCDLLLVSAGVRPETGLAQSAGLEINRGVVVDDEMRTSDRTILAAGDMVEHRGTVYGIWPASVEQAKVAAANAMGDHQTYEGTVPVTQLKVVGVDLFSLGEFDGVEGDEVIGLMEAENRRYRKLVLREGRIVGAIVLGYPQQAADVIKASKDSRDLTPVIDAIRAGRWEVLAESAGREL